VSRDKRDLGILTLSHPNQEKGDTPVPPLFFQKIHALYPVYPFVSREE
jgi:hypothetical protein